MNFEQAFTKLLGFEGGYAFYPADPGGETMWGITARVAIKNGFLGVMRQLPREFAEGIYRRDYWNACRCEELPEQLRFHVFDAAVNSGPMQAVKWLQRAVDVGEDGALGPVTMDAAQRQAPDLTIRKMTGARLELMTSLPTFGQFGRGWARRVAANLQLA